MSETPNQFIIPADELPFVQSVASQMRIHIHYEPLDHGLYYAVTVLSGDVQEFQRRIGR